MSRGKRVILSKVPTIFDLAGTSKVSEKVAINWLDRNREQE